MKNEENKRTFLYTYVRHVDEHDLCRLEMRSFFGFDSQSNILISDIEIEPSRSPFMQDRLEVLYVGNSIADISESVRGMEMSESSFKVVCLNTMDLGETEKIHHPERRQIEREVGLCIDGNPELEVPEIVFGLVFHDRRWYFGIHKSGESIWLEHMHKPHSYSTALSTRVARAVANIAVPHPEGVRAIDPCCGIGTVLVEARSMGINIVGRDINPLVCKGSRKNLAYFGLTGDVTLGPISEITENYDVAIIDMPYNLFTHITPEESNNIIHHARRIATKVVFVTIEHIDDIIEEVGFTIIDRCIAKKGTFKRQVIVCE